MCEILLRPLRWKVPSTHLLLFLPEKNRSGHLVRTALREDLENLSSCTRKLTVPVLAWGGQAVLGNIAPAWQDVANDVRGGEIEHADISLPKKNRSSPSNRGSSSLDRFKSGPRRAFPNPLAVCTGRRYTSPSYGAPRERRLPDRAGLPRARYLPARQLIRAGEGIRLEARNFRLLIEEESKCLHHHRLIQGQ